MCQRCVVRTSGCVSGLERTHVSVHQLVDRIDRGELKLPEIQRGYVWKPTQVATLIDSLYRRYPSGWMLVWRPTEDALDRPVDITDSGSAPVGQPQYLRDGQQRLTSLHRVLKRHPEAQVVFNVATLPDPERGARDGLASSLQLGPEQALVEAGTDEIIVPLGPFELVGSVSEWEDVIARERAEYQPSANAPEDRPTERFEGERRGFPIKESDEGHIAVRRLGDERADSRPPAEHHRPSPRAPMRGLTAPAACSPRWATRQSGVVRRRRRADYVRPTSAIGVVGRRSRSPLAMRVVGHAIFDVLTPEPGERRQSHGAERRSRGRGLAAVNATPIESSCRSRK